MYIKKPDDVQYRLIKLNSITEGRFMNFTGNIDPKDSVLEVKKADGSCEIIVEETRTISIRKINSKEEGNQIIIPNDVPTARLFLRNINQPDVWYHLPDNLPAKNETTNYFIIAATTQSVEIVGDKYFMAKYEIKVG